MIGSPIRYSEFLTILSKSRPISLNSTYFITLQEIIMFNEPLPCRKFWWSQIKPDVDLYDGLVDNPKLISEVMAPILTQFKILYVYIMWASVEAFGCIIKAHLL